MGSGGRDGGREGLARQFLVASAAYVHGHQLLEVGCNRRRYQNN